MKKLTAILLALILVFALSATALAEDPSTSVGEDGSTGVTSVNVAVDSSNISVTVPLSFTVVAKVDGGSAQVPSGYTIKNSSAIPVKVDTIAVSLTGTDWAFKSSDIAAGADPTTSGTNDIYLSVNGEVLSVHTAAAPSSPANWNIAASSNKDLVLVCSTSKLDQTTNATNLITITYVVSAGSHNASN